ncbi:hypothetical protein CJJ23_01625 [Mycoplasmopsis agassizii]|uniref:Uncharacterized protein n=1 Tax=Mycoplasmopsis agassizii TaxID=33922 RepID=A0A269TJ47_9BACT|nr:DnaD domain protein [Mycoplasmopsis agassizii]PAK21474.1 hypothetical protein CJJ23_01625 [Mycoplasmopsis agassizii]
MKYDNFVIQLYEEYSEKDFRNLRILYLPIIGFETAMLLQLLADQHKISKQFNYSLDRFLMSNFISINQFEEMLAQLQACGLVVAKNNDAKHFTLFYLAKINNSEEFFSNKILSSYLLKKVGQNRFNEIKSYFIKEELFDESEFTIESKSFSEVFGKVTINEKAFASEQTLTLELNNQIFHSNEEAAFKLNTEQFIYYLQGHVADQNLIKLIKTWMLKSRQNIINLVINYVWKRDGKIIERKIEKIINDLANRGLNTFEDVKSHFSNILFDTKRSLSKNLGEKSLSSNGNYKLNHNVSNTDDLEIKNRKSNILDDDRQAAFTRFLENFSK